MILHSQALMIMYKPPDSSLYIADNFVEKFEALISTCVIDNKETIIVGDINCDYLKKADHMAEKMILRHNSFKQIIKDPTRITKNTRTLIDVVLTTHDDKIDDSTVLHSISDHELIGVIRKKHTIKFKPQKITTRDYSKFQHQTYKNDLRNAPWELVLYETSLNKAWSLFKTLLKNIVDKHAPVKEKLVRGKDCQWMTKEIKQEVKNRDSCLKKARRTNTENDWSSYRQVKNVTNKI